MGFVNMKLSVIILIVYLSYCLGQIFKPKLKIGDVYDFIIVGAGTSGCVLANRLSLEADWKVLVIEAGNEENIDYDIPAIPTHDYKPILWNFKTEPNKYSCLSRPGGVCDVPAGKVVGGTSVINDMKYVRGSKYDFNDWANSGLIGWGYEDVLKFFKLSEDFDGEDTKNVHSKGGELKVGLLENVDPNVKSFVNAYKDFGITTADINTNPMEAVNINQYTHVKNTRLSSNSAFLTSARKRSNLKLIVRRTVTKVVIDKSTLAAQGVIYESKNGSQVLVFAKKEVILAAGTINSAKLLMVSGIGPKQELEALNITAIKNLPVGKFYQDQVTTTGLSFVIDNQLPSGKEIIADFRKWFHNRTGSLSTKGVNQISAYLKLYENQNSPAPDIEYNFEGNFVRSDKFLLSNVNVLATEDQTLPMCYYNTINVKPIVLKPKSFGYLKLDPKDPKYKPPLIYANLLKNHEDIETLEYAIDLALQLLDSAHLKKLGIKLLPLDYYPCNHLKVKEQWSCIIRHYTKAVGNGVGTCKMGPVSDNSTVVNMDFTVHGVKNLRVIDAAVIPSTMRANNYATTVMLGERGAYLIREQWLKKYSERRNNENDI